METAKFICEFFFTNFWHWLGLAVLLGIIFNKEWIKIAINNNKKNS